MSERDLISKLFKEIDVYKEMIEQKSCEIYDLLETVSDLKRFNRFVTRKYDIIRSKYYRLFEREKKTK